MEKEFELLVETIKKFEGLSVINTSLEPTWIHFKLTNETSLLNISNQIDDIKEQYSCSFLILDDKETFEIIIEGEDRINVIKILTKKLATILEVGGNAKKAKLKELGLPDLSLVTIRQMATELKQRHNLTFAIVWIENSEKDNIAIEGSGNPTQLVGLLSRGTHMAIEWADKNIKFYRPESE